MKLDTFSQSAQFLTPKVMGPLKKMLSPSIGICQEIGYMKRSSRDPHLITIGAELTGLHHILHRPDPGKGGYHIGGVGFFHNEAMVKTLAESMERYSQLLSEYTLQGKLQRKFASYDEMKSLHTNLLDESYLKLYNPEQYQVPGFPFDPFDSKKPMTWVELPSLDRQSSKWLPAQLIFLGYSCKRPQEPWLSTAVTTGTAAHITEEKAILSAISELIQIDGAMSRWYTNSKAIPLKLDSRVSIFQSFMKRMLNTQIMPTPTFYHLESLDLPGFNIACVFENPKGSVPRFAVGLGSELTLEKALYKAFLEGYGVTGLARLNIYKEQFLSASAEGHDQKIYDLDSNVSAYGKGMFEEVIKSKFPEGPYANTSDLHPDWTFETDSEAISYFIHSFQSTNKEIYYVDLTCKEAAELGFRIARVWSPNTLSLCLPSAVPKNHPRFKDYKGVSHDFPHPYP